MSTDYPRAFVQHGVRFHSRTTDQAMGDCPLCGAEKHFYVNVENHRWDCKKCGKRGGFATFLQDVYAAADGKASTLKSVADERGLRAGTLAKAGVRYSSTSERYLFPLRFRDGTDRMHDIRHYKLGGKVMTTATCAAGLWRWEMLDGHPREVWIAEGEWDALALIEAGVPGEVIAVPGANTWKSDWAPLLQECTVHLCYDNDPAGVDGTYRAYRALNGVASRIDVLRWSQGLSRGWDVRDEYTKNGADGFEKRIRKMLHAFPPGAETLDAVLTLPQQKMSTNSAQVNAVNAAADADPKLVKDAERVTPEEVYGVFRKWLWLPDTTLLDVVFACAIANRMAGDPLWLFLVAPPGGTKTVPLLALEQAPMIIATTTVTPAALVSGASFAGGADPSMLARFQGAVGKVLVIKDFTTVLQAPQQARDDIFGILRDAYDGKFEKTFGNGVHRRYELHMGVMAGVTPIIEQYMEQNVGLGERFMSYRTPIPKSLREQREYLKRAQKNVLRDVQMRKELGEVARAVLKYDYIGKGRMPRIPESISDKLVHAAQVVSVIRGSVTRDKYSKEITHKPFSELGTRLVKQLTKWSIGVAMFHGRATVHPDDYRTAVSMAVGSCPSGPLAFLRALYSDTAKGWTTEEAADIAGLPAFPTGERILENMSMLGAVDRARMKGGFRIRNVWGMGEELKEAINVSGVFGCQ